MFLKRLTLINYKNFASKTFDFQAKINCFIGDNGIGKTNVLDAIYHLSVGKSYFNPVATQHIQHDSDFFLIEGVFEKNNREEQVVCTLKKGQKKVLKRNEKVYKKISEHVGFLPMVVISPTDNNLIVEGSEGRRKFMDEIISQSDAAYLQHLIHYQHTLAQRNALLTHFGVSGGFDAETIAIYNEQLNSYGTMIFDTRKAFMEGFSPIFREQYAMIAGAKEIVRLRYESHLYKEGLKTLLERSLPRDRGLRYTSEGVHKDDIAFSIGEHPIKKFGSQGQQKSFLIALKLAQFQFLKNRMGLCPILLLDDIFDRLDKTRVGQLISLVTGEGFGQIFITDTDRERTEAIVKDNQSYEIFQW